jgi:hypothetical protein
MQESMQCRLCGQWTYLTREEINHKLHMWLTVCTLGLYLTIWLLITLPRTVRCDRCGAMIGKPFDRMSVVLFVAVVAYSYLLLRLQPFRW